ncbi:hypothetical protein [Streptomyces sp. NK08204]|uniref:hypothetical protein n=1 Tax=Streptomyces sp. NK08204 TaxID=2873260 RepID=UPI001CECCE49|nr:hypothetical protein [Streptomyces sp. NK08204]
MASTVLIEARKDRREAQGEWRRSKRELYGGYLATLAQVRSELQLMLLNRDMPDADRTVEALRVVARCYDLRYQLEVLAPRAVVEPALTYFRAVRRLRDAVGAGMDRQAVERERFFEDVMDTLRQARDAMRRDMGTDAMAASLSREGNGVSLVQRGPNG